MEELKEASLPLYVEEYACVESEQSINLTKGTPLVAECQVRCPSQDGQDQDEDEGAPAGQREDGRRVQGAGKDPGKAKFNAKKCR